MQKKCLKNSIFFERISQIIDYYGIRNVNDFALNYLNYKSSQKINRLKEENSMPSFEILVDISNKFEEIDANWLITGKGSMLKEQAPASQQTTPSQSQEYQLHDEKASIVAEPSSKLAKIRELKQTIQQVEENTGKILQIPVVDVWAAAGHGFYNADQPEVLGEMSFPSAMVKYPHGNYYCGRVNGDSMLPTLYNQDYIIFRSLTVSEIKTLPSNELYFIVDRSGMSCIKRVFNHIATEGYILCRSDSQDKNSFADFQIQARDIANIYHVEWRFSQNMLNLNETYFSEFNEMKQDIRDLKEMKNQFKTLLNAFQSPSE